MGNKSAAGESSKIGKELVNRTDNHLWERDVCQGIEMRVVRDNKLRSGNYRAINKLVVIIVCGNKSEPELRIDTFRIGNKELHGNTPAHFAAKGGSQHIRSAVCCVMASGS